MNKFGLMTTNHKDSFYMYGNFKDLIIPEKVNTIKTGEIPKPITDYVMKYFSLASSRDIILKLNFKTEINDYYAFSMIIKLKSGEGLNIVGLYNSYYFDFKETRFELKNNELEFLKSDITFVALDNENSIGLFYKSKYWKNEIDSQEKLIFEITEKKINLTGTYD
jgi:hypothetical protein